MIALNNPCIDGETSSSILNLSKCSSTFPGTSSSIVHSREITLTAEAKDILVKLKSFKRLQSNWDSYGGIAPAAKTIETSSSFVQQLDRWNQSVYFTAPGPNGEILIELKNGIRSIELIFTESQKIEYALFDNEECIREGEFGVNEFAQILSLLQT